MGPTVRMKPLRPSEHRTRWCARRLAPAPALLDAATQECDERRRFRGSQILAVRGHIATALDHLPNQLILSKSHRHGIKSWAALSTLACQRMAVVTLLDLKNQRALPLERRAVFQKFGGDGNPTPRVHHGTPRRVLSQVRECSKRYRRQEDSQDREGPAAPALLAFTCEKWQQQESKKPDDGTDQQRRSFHRGRKVREKCIKPQKKEIRARRGLNNGGIRRTRRTERAEVIRAEGQRKKNQGREKKILPDRIRHEWHSVLLRQLVIFLQVCGFADQASGHRPLIDSKLHHHEQVNADKRDQEPGMTNTCRAKKRESVAPAMIGPPNIRLTIQRANYRNAAGNGCSDSQSPIGILIES